MSEQSVTVQISAIEATQLARLVDDLGGLVGPDHDPADPAIARLAPSPYPDDDPAAISFHEATRHDLFTRRAHDAQVVGAALAALVIDLDDVDEQTAFAAQDLRIGTVDVDAWLRTLTALRLVLAERLGIENEQDQDDEDPAFGIYEWLGYRLEILIQAADELL